MSGLKSQAWWWVLLIAIEFVIGPALTNSCGASEAAKSEWVYPGSDGKLLYKTTTKGDRIMDFSHAGYMGGGVAIPNVPVSKTVHPSGAGDDTDVIQKAIDEVSAMKLVDGFRGAVLLAPGNYTCSEPLVIRANGVVLRGSGSGQDGSTIEMVGSRHTAISIGLSRGRGGRSSSGRSGGATVGQEFQEAQSMIADAYVPSGATSFTVSDATGFAVGDTVAINRPVTRAWVEFMQMHDLVRDGRPQTWINAGSTITTERTISTISGNKLTLDVPLTDSFDSQYLNPPGAMVVKIRPPARLTQVGVERLRIKSPLQAISHSQPHYTAMRLNGKDCWVRDVVCEETMNSIGIGGRRITLQHVAVNRKARHQGSSRPAEFAPNGGQVLLDRCSVNADNIWFVATGGRQAGPIVLLNCTFLGTSRAESHQRWSTGMLYDNCRALEGGIEFRNRGSMGSGHGWSMGWAIAWNCEADDYVIQNPPGAANWIIGCTGRRSLKPRPFGSVPNLPEGIVDSHGAPVTPQSLYLKQLAERLGPQALKNIGYSTDKESLPNHIRP